MGGDYLINLMTQEKSINPYIHVYVIRCVRVPLFKTLFSCSHFFFFYKLGVINRGDSFRRKRSRSNSLANSPMSPNQSPSVSNPSRSFGPVESHRVHMLGGPGVGKTALITQFATSDCINAYEDTGKNDDVFRYFFVCLLRHVFNLVKQKISIFYSV